MLDNAVGLGLPAIGGDQINIVLHGRGPVVHKVLIDRIGVNQRLADIMRQHFHSKDLNNILRMAAHPQLAQRCGALLAPYGEVGVHRGNEGGELGMLVDRGLDRGLLHGEGEIAGTLRPK